jgi:hypothetical protein
MGELVLLPIPEFRWDTISVDFIVELLESHGYDTIMNVMDSVSKVSHFILTHTTITALGAAHLFLTHVWKLHGLPKQGISDRGLQFVVELTWELYCMLGIKLAATTAYLQCCETPPGTGRSYSGMTSLSATSTGDCRRRRALHSGENPGQQVCKRPTSIPGKVGRIWV